MTVIEKVSPHAGLANGAGDEALYEIIQGNRVDLPPMSNLSVRVASRLMRKLGAYADAHGLGEVVSEALFRLPAPVERNRRPNVAFVSRSRWPVERPEHFGDNAWAVVPDLTAEVVSPSDLFVEITEKIEEYLTCGVTQVWVLCPERKWIHVYENPPRVRLLTSEDELDGGALLPGFRLPVMELFTW